MNQLVDNKNRYNKQKSNGQCPKNNMPKRIPSVRKKFSRFHYILYYKKKSRPHNYYITYMSLPIFIVLLAIVIQNL